MRIRTIKPEFWSHPVMAQQDDATKLLAIGLLNFADDEGFFYADPKLIRSALRPLDDDSSIVRRSLEQLAKIGYLEVRAHDTHGAVGVIVAFEKHQRVDRPKASIIKELYHSTNHRRIIDDQSSLEGNREGKGKDSLSLPREGVAIGDDLSGAFPQETIETILSVYPKAAGHYEARRVLADLYLAKVNLKEVLEGTRAISLQILRRTPADQLRIPNPARFFSERRWQDDPAAWGSAQAMDRRNGAPKKQTINDYDKPDTWTPDQMTLGGN
jgi:hypothetical protein